MAHHARPVGSCGGALITGKWFVPGRLLAGGDNFPYTIDPGNGWGACVMLGIWEVQEDLVV
jgi:hypothetical protein